MAILYFFKVQPLSSFAQTTQCVIPSLVSNLSPNNQQFAANAPVTLSWSGAANAVDYAITVVWGNNSNFYTTTNTSIPITVQNGNSYTWSIRPRNSCNEYGSISTATFSTAAASTSCLNQGQCVTCGNDDDSYQVCPELSNNCTATCSGGTPGQFNCSISQSLQSAPNLYYLTGNPANLPYQNYNWDLDGNYVYNDAQGPNVTRNFSSYTNVRLQITDANNNVAVCSTTINPQSSGSQTQPPTCSISASDSTPSNGEFVNLTANAQAYGGKNITEYNWDLDGDGNYGEDRDSQAGRNYYQDTTVRLEVRDSQGYTNTCTRHINVNENSSNQCRSIICPVAPAGCSYTGQITSSCNPNVALTCGVLTGNNCSSSGSSTVFYPGNTGNGITITNTNNSSSSSSSSNTNNNNININ